MISPISMITATQKKNLKRASKRKEEGQSYVKALDEEHLFSTNPETYDPYWIMNLDIDLSLKTEFLVKANMLNNDVIPLEYLRSYFTEEDGTINKDIAYMLLRGEGYMSAAVMKPRDVVTMFSPVYRPFVLITIGFGWHKEVPEEWANENVSFLYNCLIKTQLYGR